MNKRGISPIIATILLIAFAVAIGAMIMSWTSDIVKEAPSCKEVPQDMINAYSFCKLTDRIVPRIKTDIKGQLKYEVCGESAIELSKLPTC